MRILLTGHQGYIGAVAGPMLCSAGHEVVGLDSDLFRGCDFGEAAPRSQKYARTSATSRGPISTASMACCIWPPCRMIRWGTLIQN